jgi:cytochrome P450
VRRPPGPRTFRMVGAYMKFHGNTPAMMTAIARRYGDVAYFRVGPAGFYLLSGPDLALDVLVASDGAFERIAGERRVSGRLLHDALFASEGADHAAQRALMEPVMYGQAPPAAASAVVRFARRMADGWGDGRRIDVLLEAEHMTRDLMVDVLFGEDPTEPAGRRLADALLAANDGLNAVAFGATPLGDRLPTPSRRRFRRLLGALDRMVDELAARRIADGLAGADVLTMLLRAGDRAMSPERARNECLGLYRGHLGAGAVLSWTWFLLSQNPDVRARLEAEVDALDGDPAGLEDLRRLPVTMGSFREAIRLYPTAWLLARRAATDHPVAAVTIPAGASVLVSPWILQRDPRSWDDPESFRPGRYDDPFATSDRQGPAYLPQGLGSKRCMGMELLPVEMTLVLATVARRWRLDLPEGHRVELLPKVTLKPKGGLPMVVSSRSPEPQPPPGPPPGPTDRATP